jgi:phosphatidylserine/phosphatidylglycerophosphate/cardiolipin synthase-like enzyme
MIEGGYIKRVKTTNFGVRTMVEDVGSKVTPLPGQVFIGSLIDCVNRAKYSIDVIQYQWNFYPLKPTSQIQGLNRALLAKAESGVKVRVLLNKEGRGAHLMEINIKASKFLSDSGVQVKFGRTFPITHAKLWVFDDDEVILGSHNLSNRSVTVNNEASALIKGREVAVEFRRYFDTLWKLI